MRGTGVGKERGSTSEAVTQFLSLSIALKLQCNTLKNIKTINISPTPLKTYPYRKGVNNFVSKSVQLHCHQNFQKTHYPKISVQSPGSNRASAPRLRRLFKRNRLCVLSPTPHYGRREKESGKWESEGENLRGEGKAPLERLPLSPWVVSLTHSSNVIAQNSEPEKCYLTNRTIGSLLSQ